MAISWSSQCTLRVMLGDAITEPVQRRVHEAYAALAHAAISGLRDLSPAYATIQLEFDPMTLDAVGAERRVRETLRGIESGLTAATNDPPAPQCGRVIEVPVCYEGEFAPDLEAVAACHALPKDEVIRLHSGARYRVCFLGFSPGFAYLAGLPEGLATPRLDTPRVRVEPGSVGIAGGQTGIYPRATPGGWRIIGRTPLNLFDARRDPPALLKIADEVRFVPVSRARFDVLARGDL
jgi:inhibitor of KinA